MGTLQLMNLQSCQNFYTTV